MSLFLFFIFLFQIESDMWFLEEVSIFPGMYSVWAQAREVLSLQVSL